MKATVYSKNACTYCVQAKNLLKMKGVEITEYNIQIDNDARTTLFEECGKLNIVPRLSLNISGFTISVLLLSLIFLYLIC